MPTNLAMFPLGTVVFPYSAVPLRVFEPRYLSLLDGLGSDDAGEFGTVLIERGSEVGGGDERFRIGTRLRLMGSTEVGEGHRVIIVAGVERIRIVEWLEDDPYPRARVEPLADVTESFDVSLEIEAASARLETVMALASELGADTSELDLSVSEDPTAASFQLAALTPVTPLDSYELLAATSVDERLQLTIRMLDERAEIIRAELGEGV